MPELPPAIAAMVLGLHNKATEGATEVPPEVGFNTNIRHLRVVTASELQKAMRNSKHKKLKRVIERCDELYILDEYYYAYDVPAWQVNRPVFAILVKHGCPTFYAPKED